MKEDPFKKVYSSDGEKEIHTSTGDLPIDFIIYEKKKDGALMWMENQEQMHLTPIKDNEGKKIKINNVSEDYLANMLSEMYSFKKKEHIDRKEIKTKNKRLINSIIKELKGN